MNKRLVSVSLVIALCFCLAFPAIGDDSEGKSSLEARIEEVRKRRAEEAAEKEELENTYYLAVGKKLDGRKNITGKSKAKPEWVSSDETIATVSSNGEVKGISVGNAVITAKSADGAEMDESFKVKVVIPVKKITLSEKSFEMPEEMTWALKANVSPEDATEQKMVWSSSNEKVATVNQDGVIESHSVGNTTITAAAVDGSKAKATVKVKVDRFDFVFNEMGSHTETLTTSNYGGENIKVKTKNKLVSVQMTGYGTSITPTGIHYMTDFSISPIHPGVDVVTFSYGRSKITYRVFVSPKISETRDKLKEILDGSENAQEDSNNTTGEKPQSWENKGVGKYLPQPQLKSGEEPEISIVVNDDNQFDAYVVNTEVEDFGTYISLLQSFGYTIEKQGDSSIEASNDEGYKVYGSYIINELGFGLDNMSGTFHEVMEIFCLAPEK